MKTDNLNLGKSFEKLKDELKPIVTYGMGRTELGDMLVLTRDGKPIMPIPDEFSEDFVYILSRSASFDKIFSENDPYDLKGAIPMDEVTQEIENELLKNKP